MPEEIAVEIHGKDVSDFQLSRSWLQRSKIAM